MGVITEIIARAKQIPVRIALPEAEDERMLRAARIVQDEGIAEPILIGPEQPIRKLAPEIGINLDSIEIIEPETSPRISDYARRYVSARQTRETIALRMMKKSLSYAAMMTIAGDAEGALGGCSALTATVIKTALLVIGLKEGISVPSSFFIMEVPDCPYGEKGAFLFADAGFNPNPTAEELAEIAITTAKSASDLLGWEPRVAMLSFSTRGSASHEDVGKVLKALSIAKERAPELAIDGEFQLDAAISVETASLKLKEPSEVAGRANVLIFPDLDAGNIGYKLTRFLAKAKAYGPILQGLKKPFNDLSRGASVEDIVGVTAITVVQAQKEVQG